MPSSAAAAGFCVGVPASTGLGVEQARIVRSGRNLVLNYCNGRQNKRHYYRRSRKRPVNPPGHTSSNSAPKRNGSNRKFVVSNSSVNGNL